MTEGLTPGLRSISFIGIAVIMTTLALVFPHLSLAESAGPAWEVSSVAQPTNFTTEDNAKCKKVSEPICDRYAVTLTNVGGGPTTGPVSITDALPQGLRAIDLLGENLEFVPGYSAGGFGWACSVATITCTYGEALAPGATLVVLVEVEVIAASPPHTVTNVVTVSGGGAAPVSSSAPLTLPNTVGGSSDVFGIAALGFAAHDSSGRLDTQAGDHPYGVTTTVNVNTKIETYLDGSHLLASVEPIKDVVVYLPLGFLGDPTAAAHCTEIQLVGKGPPTLTECPSGSRVGSVSVFTEQAVISSIEPESNSVVSAVYNMLPDAGYPAQFGFKVFGHAVQLYASVVHTPSGYALRVAAPGVPRVINVEGSALTLFGDPNTVAGKTSEAKAFFTNPGNCGGGPLNTRVEVDSWGAPGQWSSQEAVAYPRITGCELLQFAPTVTVHPEVSQAEAPTGLQVKIKAPQNPAQFPVLAVPQLKDVTMTLPRGMAISPGSGDGLAGCAATGPDGIDMPSGGAPDHAGEGEAIGPDGMSQLVAGHCPPASQIGTVEIATPVLEDPLEGHVYVAQPQCGGDGQPQCTTADAADGHLFGLYLEAAGSGVVVKLAGSVSADPSTGQLTARFTENPQLPVSEITLDLKGGGRAPLANPRQCGEAVAGADIMPWSSPITPDALVSAPFNVDWDGSGGACPGATPFAPSLNGGVTNAAAGHFSDFTFTLTRGDRQQDLSRVQVKLPAGMLGLLAKVPLCEEPQAAQGACPEASRIGTTLVRVGSGSQPLGVAGRIYLTRPYAGAPFGLSIVVPAVAGPFNLGNVVVRSRIDIDPATSAAIVTSDPLPQVKDGVPLHLQTITATVDRPEFLFNPTNCAIKQIAATVESAQGASTSLTTPVAADGCNSLPFKPSFKVSTQARTSKAKGASLTVKVTERPGEANIQKVDLRLPVALPARLTTLQKACTAAQFEANPAGCPAASVIGTAKAITPVLKAPLQGPAYLVSHGGAAFPDVEFVLQADERGGEVQIVLDGKTQIKRGVTYSRFETVPDAPISSFETVLPQGPHSALGTNIPAKAKGSLCGQRLVVPTTLTGQNGAVVKQSTKVTVTGCAKGKPKRAKKAGSARRSADRKRGR
jgi:hypothetical protein